ncbi:hypothetical protein AVEN_143706-1 [Araneus ventricosus]|uniref:Uncharacterized protein n=1 Tax=Araneus ventricosus TaxID=182803 RepID=A0A4Y2ANF3_ARAVE|nr:hypothetical protein AVEN_143706-1 [Araneus ventricosus]
MSSYNSAQISSILNATSEFSPTSSEICVISQEDGDPHIHKCIQVNFQKPYRSRGTNTSVQMTAVGCSTSNMGVSVGTATSPEKLQQNVDTVDIENDTSSSDFNATNEAENTDNSSESEAVEQSM